MTLMLNRRAFIAALLALPAAAAIPAVAKAMLQHEASARVVPLQCLETNPALVINHFMQTQLGIAPIDIDMESVKKAAAYCDERALKFDWKGVPEDPTGVEFITHGLRSMDGVASWHDGKMYLLADTSPLEAGAAGHNSLTYSQPCN